ncbi:TPA: hypothetical protein DIC40_04540 [Patescibacteria group bacterium]|nr:hypothetical protein [Candidatus Gracilibacteria bacterium]
MGDDVHHHIFHLLLQDRYIPVFVSVHEAISTGLVILAQRKHPLSISIDPHVHHKKEISARFPVIKPVSIPSIF